MTQIPYIDQVYWEEINTFLSQMISSSTGGIHFWNGSNPKPVHLSSEHEGLTGWEESSQTLQRWTGTEWLILIYSTDILKPLIYKYLLQNNQSPSWLVDLIRNTFINWNPLLLPQWIIDAFDYAIANMSLASIKDLLYIWVPTNNSILYRLITDACFSGGLTEKDVIDLFKLWNLLSDPLSWLTKYLNRVCKKSWSNLEGEAFLRQIEDALEEWWLEALYEKIKEELSFSTYTGQFSYKQIEQALNWWFNSSRTILLDYLSLKQYIDNKDTSVYTYITNIFSSLEEIEDKNHKVLLELLNKHTHNSTTVPIPNFTTYAAWPNTQANSINTYNYPVIIGACVTNRLNSIGLGVFPYDHSQSVWGNYSARLKVVVLPSSVWPDKSGVNNSPNGVTTSSLLAATSNVITINCPDTSIQYATTTSFSHISDDNMYFVYLIWERVYWPDKYIDKPMTGIVTFFKSDNSVLTSTMTTGPSTPANMRYSTFYGHYNGSGEATP